MPKEEKPLVSEGATSTDIGARFKCEDGPGKGRVFVITKPIMVFGREDDSDFVLKEDDKVSRHHAEVSFKDGKFYLTDKGSSNGTVVNNELVKEIAIKNGDSVVIGHHKFIFSC